MRLLIGITLVIVLFTCGVAMLYALRRTPAPSMMNFNDVLNIVSLIVNVVLFVVALVALMVSFYTYVGAETSSKEQQKVLESSRGALETIITRAETQQKLLGSMLTTQETQYKLIAQQVKEEQERRARKPEIEIYADGLSESEMIEGGTKGWNPDSFHFKFKNIGSAELIHPVVTITAYPVYVYLSDDSQVANDKKNSIQYAELKTLAPYADTHALADLPRIFRKLPSDIKSWELVVKVFGDNYHRPDLSIHFTVPSPPQAPPQ